jgi:pimeloyl-ACP methyl ester carboxylesterase
MKAHGTQRLDAVPAGNFALLPWWHPVKLGVRVLIWILVAFVAICGLMYLAQGKLIYPGAGYRVTPEQADAEARAVGLKIWTPEAGGEPTGFILPDFLDPAPRGTIVLLHGNGEVAWQHASDAQKLKRAGFRTLLYEYPGYGGRSGSPSERVIVPDLRAAIRSLDRQGLGPIYLWGQSLGSGVAAAACADETLPVRGLLLITPFDSLPNVGAAFYPFLPVHWLMTDRYDSLANLAHFAHPICLARSDQDEVIPPRLSMNLYAHLPEPKKEIVFVGAHHNDWAYVAPPSWLDEALDFIAPRK